MSVMLDPTPDNPLLPNKLRPFIPLTGLNDHEFNILVRTIGSTLASVRGRPWSLPLPVRILLVAVALRTNITTRAIAVLFTTTQSTADRIIRHLTPIIGNALRPKPSPSDEGMWLIWGYRPPLAKRVEGGGTLILPHHLSWAVPPVHDQTRTALSKNYRRSINTQIMTRYANRRVIAIGKTWPGNRNDIIVAKATMTEVSSTASPGGTSSPSTQSSSGRWRLPIHARGHNTKTRLQWEDNP